MAALVLVIFSCTLILAPTTNAVQKTVTSVTAKDKSANSVSRQYSYNPVGLYAGASPYGAFSFYAPTYVSGPHTASSQIVPVKEENTIVHNSNGFLKDSYGNRFVETPQSIAYKTVLPQQFVQLQDLPAHLSQPLLAAAPSYNLKQQSPQYYYASSHYSPLQTIPSVTHFMQRPQSIVYGQNFKSLTPSYSKNVQSYNQAAASQRPHAKAPSTPQQQSSSNKAVYANSQNPGYKSQNTYQQLRENPQKIQTPKSFSPTQSKEYFKKAPATQSITTTVNGKKTVINLDTKPPLPLLDISLLEPLTFANPVVPQIQHFLPRIPSATYHKLPNYGVEAKKHDDEFIVTNTRSYNSEHAPETSAEDSSENNEKSAEDDSSNENQSHYEEKEKQPTPQHDNKQAHNSQKTKSPNYKETFNEKVISYNKKTENPGVSYSYSKNSQQDPVHYSYSKQSDQKPIHYSNVYSSNKPIRTKEIDCDSEDRSPKQIIYEFQNNKPQIQRQTPKNVPSHSQPESSESDESGVSEEDEAVRSSPPPQHATSISQSSYNQHRPATSAYYHQPEHRQEIRQSPVAQKEQFAPIQYLKLEPVRQPIRINVQEVTPPEYEENIQFWPLTHASVKVNPSQHINQKPTPQAQNLNQHNSQPQSEDKHHKKGPSPHFHGTSKHIIIKNEAPDEKHLHQEKMMKEETNHEENSEEDFEKSYKNSAYGFPAFEKISEEEEREFDPDNYGVPQYHTAYNIEDNPFQQYQSENDEYPKSTRANYKDVNDKTKEDYYLDYSINKPESLVDQYQKKIDYYKMFRNHKKDDYSPSDHDDRSEKQSKYAAAPSYGFDAVPRQKTNKHAEYRAPEQQFYEYSYSNEAPKDSSADPTHSNLRTKSKTQFVEPQFQYGFEPVPLPSLLDSELSAVASNNNHRSENPEVKKKSYKENFYIKKTNTSGGKPPS